MPTPTTGTQTGPARVLARALAERAEAVCRHYLPGGRKSGRYWMVGNVRGEPGRSLYVRLAPPGTPGWWNDAATGERGDLLELIRRRRGDSGMAGAMAEARQFLGDAPVPARPWPGAMHRPDAHRRPDAHGRAEAPRRLWALCRSIDGTPAEAYLRARGIRACRHPALGFHPAVFYRNEHDANAFRRLPALVARVTDAMGSFVGLQRIYLDPVGPGKAPVTDAKKCMGRVHGAAVLLGSDSQTLVVAEGIETALSVLTARPELRGAAALSAAGLAAFTPPGGTRRVLVARDNDPAGIAGAERLAARCHERGLAVATLAPVGGDFNDDLLASGAAALGTCIDNALEELPR